VSASGIPMIIVIVPVEGDAVARIVSATYEEELRVALDVWSRDTLLQVGRAIAQLRTELEERERQR
jgi:hypothetical protein